MRMYSRRMTADWRTAVPAGLAVGAVGIGVGEVLAAFLGGSPVGTVASTVIDLSPSWLKELVIAVAGTADKVVLVVCLLLVGIGAAVVAGFLEVRRPPWGSTPFGVLCAVAAACAMTRPDGTLLSGVPALLGTVAAVAGLRFLARLSARAAQAAPAGEGSVSRRTFLLATTA